MRWVAPTEKDEGNHALEKRLWETADQFRANSGLKAGEYSGPVLGLIFLRFAEARLAKRRAELEKAGASPRRGNSRIDDPKAYMAEGVLYLTPSARLLKELLKKVSEIPVSLDFDAFGRIYEYFLGQFARTEGQKGGEFYTPAPIVRLMVSGRLARMNLAVHGLEGAIRHGGNIVNGVEQH